ncbi:MAG: hypothetical protein ACTS2F_06675 [Thainema sp.]
MVLLQSLNQTDCYAQGHHVQILLYDLNAKNAAEEEDSAAIAHNSEE